MSTIPLQRQFCQLFFSEYTVLLQTFFALVNIGLYYYTQYIISIPKYLNLKCISLGVKLKHQILSFKCPLYLLLSEQSDIEVMIYLTFLQLIAKSAFQKFKNLIQGILIIQQIYVEICFVWSRKYNKRCENRTIIVKT